MRTRQPTAGRSPSAVGTAPPTDASPASVARRHFGDLVDRLETELDRSRKVFSSTASSIKGLLSLEAKKKKESVFKTSDFEDMLKAKEAFLLVQGKGLAPGLKHRLTKEKDLGVVTGVAEMKAEELDVGPGS